MSKKYYRVTIDGDGVYEYLKQHIDPEMWKSVLQDDRITWLPKPNVDYKVRGAYKSYFNQKGLDEFNLKVREVIKEVQPSLLNQIKTTTFKDPPGITVYEDEYQIVKQY